MDPLYRAPHPASTPSGPEGAPHWDELPTPSLVIDLATARRNITATLGVIGSADRWRPHVKTAKVPEVLALYLDAGVRQFKCATLLEAEVLAATRSTVNGDGPTDILVAHHLFGPALRQLDELASAHPAICFSTLAEAAAQVTDIPISVGVFEDLDLGMHRTGLSIDDGTEIEAIASAAGPRFRGLHAYDGHRHDPSVAERERLAHEDYDRLLEQVRRLEAAGLPPAEVITSGTPSYPVALTHSGLGAIPHRVSPGTVVYHDLRTRQQLPDIATEYAATVLTRVASLPGDDLFTVNAGSKAIEAASPSLIAQAIEWPDAVAQGQSEEHTVFRVKDGKRPKRGELLRLVPGHVCPTVNLASRAYLMESGKGLGFVPVAARGH